MVNLVKFTQPDGDAAYISPAWVVVFRKVLRGESHEQAQTRIDLSGVAIFVRESIEEVAKALRQSP